MAYVNIVKEACADKTEFFCRMRDFLCKRNGTYDYSTTGIGWTLHDSSYAVDEDNPQINDWYVIYSPGLGGKDQIYMHIKWMSGYVYVYGYLYWNNSTHAGVGTYSGGGPLQFVDTAVDLELSIWGDLDFVYVLESAGFSYVTHAFFGKLTNDIYDDTIATSSSSLSSGSAVEITLDSVPSSWAVDDKIFIRDNANVDVITILSINGNVITADLAHSFSADCRLQLTLSYGLTYTYSNINMYLIVGQITDTPATINVESAGNLLTNLDPDALGNNFVRHMHLVSAGNYKGRLPYSYQGSLGTGMTPFDVFVDQDGNDWRFIKIYTGIYLYIKEV